MKKSIKISAVILAVAAAVSTSVFAMPVNAAAADTTAQVQTVIYSVTDTVWNISKITDTNHNIVNPYEMFGSSFKLAHKVVFNANGSFDVFIGADNAAPLHGMFEYNKINGKVMLDYTDGFKAIANAGYNNGKHVLRMPVKIAGIIYIMECTI